MWFLASFNWSVESSMIMHVPEEVLSYILEQWFYIGHLKDFKLNAQLF
jgi:hypothetical protein